jgi:hypothetical protein
VRVDLEARLLDPILGLGGVGVAGGGPGQIQVDVEEGEGAVVLEDGVLDVQGRGPQVVVDVDLEGTGKADAQVRDAIEEHVAGVEVGAADGQGHEGVLGGAAVPDRSFWVATTLTKVRMLPCVNSHWALVE